MGLPGKVKMLAHDKQVSVTINDARANGAIDVLPSWRAPSRTVAVT
jgi:hypothetical protein